MSQPARRLICNRVFSGPASVPCNVERCVECKEPCWISKRLRKKRKGLRLRVTCWECALDLDEIVELDMLDEVLAEASEFFGRPFTREEAIDVVARGLSKAMARRFREKLASQ